MYSKNAKHVFLKNVALMLIYSNIDLKLIDAVTTFGIYKQ